MSGDYLPSVSLHQQDGGMSVQAFADREGLTLKQARYCIKRGKVLGARQDARSKHWWIYPPAKLMERPRDRVKTREPGSAQVVDFGTSPHGLSADLQRTEQETRERLSRPPSAKPVLTLEAAAEAAGLVGALAPTKTADTARKPGIYTEARSVCQALHEAAARQFREGLHYLRLDAHEFAQLYAALDNDRSRVRKLVGRGVLPVGLLRASDSVWQKMQAMSREGKLL